ncbi:MAG: hypothetical protein QXV73_00800 [Candidatus Micrarchaeia archaeon]
MSNINKKQPTKCPYFSNKLIINTLGLKRNGKVINEFYYKCTLTEDIMCERSTNLLFPLLGSRRICIIKER